MSRLLRLRSLRQLPRSRCEHDAPLKRPSHAGRSKNGSTKKLYLIKQLLGLIWIKLHLHLASSHYSAFWLVPITTSSFSGRAWLWTRHKHSRVLSVEAMGSRKLLFGRTLQPITLVSGFRIFVQDCYVSLMNSLQTYLIKRFCSSSTDPSVEVVCPICASAPGGDPNLVTNDITGHLTVEHSSGGTRSSSSGKPIRYNTMRRNGNDIFVSLMLAMNHWGARACSLFVF